MKTTVVVSLSDKACVFCGEKTDTLAVKSKQHDFQANVCPKHLLQMMKKWEGQNPPAEAQGSRGTV